MIFARVVSGGMVFGGKMGWVRRGGEGREEMMGSSRNLTMEDKGDKGGGKIKKDLEVDMYCSC